MIIDAHAYVFPPSYNMKYLRSVEDCYKLKALSAGTIADAVLQADHSGTDKLLISGIADNTRNALMVNQFVEDSVKADPERLMGLACINPDIYDAEDLLNDALQRGFVGIMLQPGFQNVKLNSPKAMTLFEMAYEKTPIFIHLNGDDADETRLNRLKLALRSYRNMDWIISNSGSFDWMRSILDDLSALGARIVTSGMVEFMGVEETRKIIDLFGADNIIYGSCFPMRDMKQEIKLLESVPMTDAEHEKIFGENILGIFKKYEQKQD
ncbi:MAG: amidohydrolase family protein [Clostridiales bacterium]|nr:amidohydrolase family protein [Clostridiales bacterium]